MEDKISRILIVDDNKDIHEDLRHILNPSQIELKDLEVEKLKNELFGEDDDTKSELRIQYQIDDAYQGEEGVQKVQLAIDEGNPYALIFMDVRMPPGMDGIQTIEKIWKIYPYVQIVICTAYSDYSWEQILAKFGQTDHLLFIKKPFDSVSVRQITLALTTKFNLEHLNRNHINNLESEVKRRTQELICLANYDPLTKLLNRYSFYQSLYNLIRNGDNAAKQQRLYLFFIDIDGFKQVNDLLGHDIGDVLLQEISERIKLTIGKDTVQLPSVIEQDCKMEAIFRLGGDEFTAIISSAQKEEVHLLANKLGESIKSKYIIAGHEIYSSCSIGISTFPDDAEDPNILLKYADLAMYRAKESGGTHLFFDNIKDTEYIRQLELDTDLKNIVINEEIEIEYQGLLDSKEQIIGIEALVRWNHPQLGILKPDQFIYIAEKNRTIFKIGEYILKLACQHLNELHQAGHSSLFVLVNCTINQFYDPNFINIVKSNLAEVNLDPKYLKLGLEEKFSLQDPEKSLEVIKQLDELGVQLTIDGLGRGKSLINFLQHLPQNTIVRIDKAYVHNIVKNKEDQEFLWLMLDLIRSRNLNAIVSGIETPEQKKLLTDKDCIFQGFYFNKPKPFRDLVKEIINNND